MHLNRISRCARGAGGRSGRNGTHLSKLFSRKSLSKSDLDSSCIGVKQNQPFLPGMNRVLCGKPPKSTLAQLNEKLANLSQSSLSELSDIFGKFIPVKYLQRKSEKQNSRERVYSQNSTFWAFLFQSLSPATSCLEVVHKIQSYCSLRSLPVPSSSTAAYCAARKRIKHSDLLGAHESIAGSIQAAAPAHNRWKGMEVKVVDGTGITLSDTDANRSEFTYAGGQKPGCGFPVITLVACFSLTSGALLRWVESTLKSHESRVFRNMMDFFGKGDVALADRGYCSFLNFHLLAQRGAHAVMRLHQQRKIDYRSGKALGKHDRIFLWNRPNSVTGYSKEEVQALPERLEVRVVRVQVEVRGYRTRKIDIATTILDPKECSHEDLADLYYRRWAVELYFRHIKTTMGMESLRGRTPEMVRKEIVMFAIAYNLVRAAMQHGANALDRDVHRASFKSAVDTIRQYQSSLNCTRGKPRIQRRIIDEMLSIIATEKVPLRPGRVEPRAMKKRPKCFQYLTSPRHVFKASKSRKRKSKIERKVA